MCGIIGTTNKNTSDEIFRKALSFLVNRGPDFQSYKKGNSVTFGHTRLAILDLDKRSNQPFLYQSKSKNLLLTFNGEIYNFQEIKEELASKNHVFTTNSDTEVVAAAYTEWGLSCFDRFKGMWALAIEDDDKLVLSRDRNGKKPLYYSSNNNIISFSSSLNSLKLISGNSDISKEGIELYFALGFIPKRNSVIRNINKLLPGEILVFKKNQEGYVLKSTHTSKYNYKPKTKYSLKSSMEIAVKSRIISDVPISTLMSGGVDSTIVSALAKKSVQNLQSFFVDFEDKEFSEKKWADYLVKKNNINLKTVLLNDDDLSKAFKDYYNVYEEPFADYSGIPSIAIFKKVAEGYKVVLTGDGGDELFYGYPHYTKKTIVYIFFGILNFFKNNKFIPRNLKNIISGKKENFESNYLKNHGIITNYAAILIDSEFNSSIKREKSFLKGIIDYDRNFYNWPEKYLTKVDRASMFNSIEVRSPFMDEDLLKKVLKLPVFFLFTPFSKKLYLKLRFFNSFGFKYLFAKKKGFTPPIQNFRNKYFNEINLLELKEFIKPISTELYIKIKNIEFKELLEDKILFDRFFFFSQWIKSTNNN